MIKFLILLCILLFLLYLAKKSYGPENFYFNKGYGTKKESIETLLNRIDWANHYKGRLNIGQRHAFYAFFIVLVLSGMSEKENFSFSLYFQMVFITFFILQSFYFYTQHHCEKFGHYAIDRNLKILYKKLGLKHKNVSPTSEKFPGPSDCWNFTFRNEI